MRKKKNQKITYQIFMDYRILIKPTVFLNYTKVRTFDKCDVKSLK